MPRECLFDAAFARRAARSLARRDARLARLARRHGTPVLPSRRPGGGFAFLARSVLNQQLAVPAAAAIVKRVQERICAGGALSSRNLLAAGPDALRACGVSGPKCRTLLALARAEAEGSLRLRSLSRASDRDAIDRLTALHGVGRWTAQMFLIFHLGRPDVFPETDLAVVDELGHLLGLPARPKPSAAAESATDWAPYRSVAAWWMWRERSGRPPGIR